MIRKVVVLDKLIHRLLYIVHGDAGLYVWSNPMDLEVFLFFLWQENLWLSITLYLALFLPPPSPKKIYINIYINAIARTHSKQ